MLRLSHFKISTWTYFFYILGLPVPSFGFGPWPCTSDSDGGPKFPFF